MRDHLYRNMMGGGGVGGDQTKLQALAYNILPPSTTTNGYTIDLPKLSVNGQFFIDAQIAVCL